MVIEPNNHRVQTNTSSSARQPTVRVDKQENAPQPNSSGNTDDTVSLSFAAKAGPGLEAAINNESEVNHDLVASIKEKIQSGSYQVDSQVIAAKLASERFE